MANQLINMFEQIKTGSFHELLYKRFTADVTDPDKYGLPVRDDILYILSVNNPSQKSKEGVNSLRKI